MARTIIRDLFYGFIVFTIIIVAGIGMIRNIEHVNTIEDYNGTSFQDAEMYTKFNSAFNQSDLLLSETQNLEGNVNQTIGEDSGFFAENFGFLDALISNSWYYLQLIFGSFGFIKNAFTGLNTVFGLPSWLPTLLGLLITVLIAFAIYSAIFQREV